MIDTTFQLVKRMADDLLNGTKRIIAEILEESDNQSIEFPEKCNKLSMPIYNNQGQKFNLIGLAYQKPNEEKLYESDFFLIVQDVSKKKIYLSLKEFDNFQLFRVLEYLSKAEKYI